ncbi:MULTISPECIES: hypothetical protein [Okeania]|uniref:hypothetical protein n=1 Tax=Okeania TaxID=1458928 RepID=UPI0026AB1EF6
MLLVSNHASVHNSKIICCNRCFTSFGEKPERWEPSGKRVNRGLYRSATGKLINADANGAGNIIKKVATQLSLDLAKVGREVLMLPQRYKLDDLTRKYRKQCVAWL